MANCRRCTPSERHGADYGERAGGGDRTEFSEFRVGYRANSS